MKNGLSVVSCQLSVAAARPAGAVRRCGGGFTLIELLVVILIILLVSAVALPVVLPALSHRQVSEAARMLQGALVGARDSALHNGTPSGIRLLPDPAFPLVYRCDTGQIDPTQPLAANRIIPIEAAPEYSEGMLSLRDCRRTSRSTFRTRRSTAGGSTRLRTTPCTGNDVPATCSWSRKSWCVNGTGSLNKSDLVVLEHPGRRQAADQRLRALVHGRRADGRDAAARQFRAVRERGAAGTQSPFRGSCKAGATSPVNPEFLFLVNGLDDNKNGWIDEGYDGVDNNLSLEVANGAPHLTDELARMGRRGLAGDDARPILLPTCRTRSSGGRRRSAMPARSRCRRTS